MSDRTTTLTCPAWCQTDHDAERAHDAAQDAETHAYIAAQDPSWTGTAVISDTVLHSRVVGEMPVHAGRNAMSTLTLLLQECPQDGDGPVLYVNRQGGSDDYTPAEAAAFADLWALGRRMLAEADGTTARRDSALLAEQEAVDAATPAAVPPCPSWCTEPAGHGYELVDGDLEEGLTFVRHHFRDTGTGALAALVQEESNRTGQAELQAPTVDVYSFAPPRGANLDLEQALRLASDLAALTAQLVYLSGSAAKDARP